MISFLKRQTHLHGPRGWAAIFFGDDGLHVSATRGAGHDVEIEHEAAADQTGDAASAWEPAVASVRQKIDPHEHRIVTAVSCEDVLCQTLRLPTSQPSELKQMIDLQIDNLTPLPMEEIVYSFEPLETTGTETRVLVAVARKAAVNERVAALEAAGLPPEVVSVDALAMFRAFLKRELLPLDEKLNAFVQIGARAADMIAYSRGQPVAVRSVVLGDHLVESTEPESVWREELQRTLIAAQAELPGAEIGRVTFAARTSGLRDTTERVAAGWNGERQLYIDGAAPSPSLSLCMEGTAAQPRLNLLPDEWRQRRRAARVRRMVIQGAIAVGVLYLLVVGVFLVMMGLRQTRFSRMDAQVKRLQPQYTAARQLHEELVAMQKQLDTKYSGLEVLREVSTRMPEGLKLNQFVFKRDQNVTLRGQSQSASMTYDFISKLEQCDLFSSVKTVQVRNEGAAGLTKFEVVCTLKSAAPVPVGVGYGTK
jgi:type II secretory pathway component PulM